jgi:hypothetical protein
MAYKIHQGENSNKYEIRFVFVCIGRVKATKRRGKSRSKYPFLFLFLSCIRRGLRRSLL